ncbi:pathogenesis-related protein PR-4-like [Panicum virgatum]|uniref:Barwin domain-containing protein n=1 Tax=Panicum virgatum TaxID=38727 RepID=A0A8T0PQX8_PANVG|nr:pathogenesis-related protein PR-4-like [Panicum virgatum]KAG2562949.1 hypothetical protein PVAP13_8KG305300 [Panicum virgatum]
MENVSKRTTPAAAAAALALALLVACAWAARGAAAQRASGVTAVRNSYAASLANWDLRAVCAYCATWDADMPLAWRQRYGWAAFCGPAGPRGEASCGRCLMVANAATGAQATVRVLDRCSFGGLGLDPFVFNQLDTDGHGAVTGQLTVSYQFVDCQD